MVKILNFQVGKYVTSQGALAFGNELLNSSKGSRKQVPDGPGAKGTSCINQALQNRPASTQPDKSYDQPCGITKSSAQNS